jgi:putative hemolysin
MTAVAIELIVIFLLLLANGVFAMSEIAVVTARRGRLERLAATGNQRARTALELAREPTQFLSTVQVGITLIGIVAGAFGGASLADRLDVRLEQIAWIAPFSEAIAFTLVVGAITYLSVIIGELVPKRIALSNPERIAAAVARPMRVFAKIGAPVVSLLTKSTNALFRLLPVADRNEPAVTEEDIRALLAQGTAAGAVHEREQHIAERVLRLGDRPVSAIMTPRPDVDWIDVEDPPDTVPERLTMAMRSRFLVCEGSIDKVLGVVPATDVLVACLAGAPIDIRAHLRQPLFVPSTMPALALLEAFRTADVHVAIVLDEFGSVKGIATLNDILEDLVATGPGPASDADRDIVRRDDGSWLVDGTVPVEELAAIGVDALSADRPSSYRTVGGLVMTELGHVPRVGERFEFGGFRFEVMDMDGRRIDRVLVARSPSLS